MQHEKTGILSSTKLLEYWLGNRKLTRKVIEKFPEKELFEFSVSGMRPFAKMAIELISIGSPALKSIVHKENSRFDKSGFQPKTKAEILQRWDEETELIKKYYKQIPDERFPEKFNLFGEYDFPIIENIFYFIDNEIHHTAQGFVYLRALGIEPPFFWDK